MYQILKFKRARNCLKFLTKALKISEMYIPYYLCDVMRHALAEANCKPLFYHIDDNFYPQEIFQKDSYILYPNYFGICGGNVKQLAQNYPKLIVDNAHAFYDEPIGFACFNSGAKFNRGENAYLWVNSDLPAFSASENRIQDITFAKDESIRRKFIELHKTYSSINKLKISAIENFEINIYPFCYPLLLSEIEEADKIVKDLNSKNITIYRYWNRLPISFCEYKFYSRLVPIPIAEEN